MAQLVQCKQAELAKLPGPSHLPGKLPLFDKGCHG
jgi:hypothetical protein